MVVMIIIGLFFIGIGFIVKYQPDLIAGYNTMSYEKKKNVDIAGLSAFMKRVSVILGITIISLSIVAKVTHNTVIFSIIIPLMFTGIVVMVIMAQRYDHNGRKHKITNYIILGAVFIFTIGMTARHYLPAKEIFDGEKVTYTGSYGFDLSISDIETIEMVDEIPKIKIRTNGVSTGYIRKGWFNLESWGRCRLFMTSNNPPFLIVTKNNGERIIINSREKNRTENIYAQLKEKFDQ